ncbi:MAG: TrmB family transcriptional regulator [Promethearchaeota archaeon]
MDKTRIIAALEAIGLHKNEILIYIDLIKIGSSSAHDIATRTKIHRPNVYDTLEKLTKKGIVTQSIEKNKKIFYPVSPKSLINYLKQKEYNLQEIIPEMEKIHSKPKEERKVTMSEGIRSIRNILDSFLEIGEPIYVYGIPKNAIEDLGGFIRDFHERRIKKGISMKHVYNKNAYERIKELNNLELTEAKYLPSLYDTTTTTNICGNKVVLIFWEDPVCAIIIENASIANSYKKYFDIVWEEAKMNF